MPHQRPRELLPLLLKRIKLWPVIGIIGVRQCGKSVLLRDLFHPKTKHRYTTMDSKTERERAKQSPEAFSQLDKTHSLLVIDEVQKTPDLFDAIKLHVDENRRPGMYVISGSTEFSQMTKIRESLTGRIGLMHLYPMNLSELYKKNSGDYFLHKKNILTKISLNEFDKKLARGGMPGLCFLRSDAEYQAACSMWLETTCYRDISQIKSHGFDGALGLEILAQVVQLSEPAAHVIAKKLRRDTRVIQRYLDAFEAILVLIKLAPHEAGVGKNHYILCDSGIAHQLGASRETLLRTHILIEALSTFENKGQGRPLLKYYRNEKSSFIPLIFEWSQIHKTSENMAIHFYDGEGPQRRETMALSFFAKRLDKPMRLILLSQARESYFEISKQKSITIECHPLRG